MNSKGVNMPQLGEIRQPKDIGYKGHHKYIWSACNLCGKQRWVNYRNGKAEFEICSSCTEKGLGFWWKTSKIHPNLGKHLKPETKAKISEKNTQKPNLCMNPNFAYFLGIHKGDGTAFRSRNEHRIEISPGLNEEFADECVKLFSILNLRSRKHLAERYWKVTSCSKVLYNYLKSIEISDILSEAQVIEAFWLGMFRAEGNLSQPVKPNQWQRLTIANTDERLMFWGKTCLEKLDYHPKLYKNKKNGYRPCYVLTLSRQNEVSRFLSKLNERHNKLMKSV